MQRILKKIRKNIEQTYQMKEKKKLKKKKEKIICDCGCIVARSDIAKQKKTQKRINLMKEKEEEI